MYVCMYVCVCVYLYVFTLCTRDPLDKENALWFDDIK